MTLEFTEFIRKPFKIEAVLITDENLEAVARFVGDVQEEDGRRHIFVDRRIVPNVTRVYPGHYMTRMGDNIRCYTRKAFFNQFAETTPEILEWVDFMNEPKQAQMKAQKAS